MASSNVVTAASPQNSPAYAKKSRSRRARAANRAVKSMPREKAGKQKRGKNLYIKARSSAGCIYKIVYMVSRQTLMGCK